jgi:hypothetical protein
LGSYLYTNRPIKTFTMMEKGKYVFCFTFIIHVHFFGAIKQQLLSYCLLILVYTVIGACSIARKIKSRAYQID